MKIFTLRIFRIFFSMFFFTGLLIFFIDPSLLFASFNRFLVSLQFLPALKQYIMVHSLSAAFGLILISLLTLFFGRVYCSHLCPLGALQDTVIFFKKKVTGIKKFSFYYFPKIISYAVLAVLILLVANKINLYTNLLDPFSNFGRITVNIFKPVYIFITNIIAGFLGYFKIYLIYQIHGFSVPLVLLTEVFIFFIIIIISAILWGRWYCQFCPVGTILGICSKISVFKIKMEKDKCLSCAQCEAVCRSGCIDSKHKVLDWQRCVGCFDCLDVCPHSLIHYKVDKASNEKKTDSGRRNFLLVLSAGLFGLVSSPLRAQIMNSLSYKIPKRNPVSPPGSVSHEYYNRNCTACHACISVCPNRVLIPAIKDFGLKGVFQPKLDYSSGFCGYDCNLCSQVCPVNAIKPVSVPEKKLIQIGVVRQIKENCIVYRKGLECGACSEQCPTKAVYLVPYHGLHAPVLNQDICIGCGACENVCPVRPDKAIYVDGLKVHKKARAPVKTILKKQADKGFPF